MSHVGPLLVTPFFRFFMDNTRVFKFATLRNASDLVSTQPDLVVQPASPLVVDLIAINENVALSNAQKLAALNLCLQTYINSDAFLKSKSAVDASKAQTGTVAYYDLLYDNIVARTITKSNTTQIYKLVVDQLRTEHVLSKLATFPAMAKSKVKIVLPDGLIFNFIGSNPATVGNQVTVSDSSQILNTYSQYTTVMDLIEDAKAEKVLEFRPNGQVLVPNTAYSIVNDAFSQASISVAEVQELILVEQRRLARLDQKNEAVASAIRQMALLQKMVNQAKEAKITTFESTKLVAAKQYDPILNLLKKDILTIDAADKLVSKQLQSMSKAVISLAPKTTYTRIGDQWVDTSQLSTRPESKPTVTDNAILVYSHGCWLKFPFQIADLRVVEQQTVGYLPGEIAHINNTQPGELNTRVTRRLKRTEDFESILTEDEVSHETDTQSTEKFGLEKEASKVQTEESSWNVNASVSGSFGPVTASVDGGYESSSSATNSNSASQTYAKEIVQKVVDRVSHKVKLERSTKTIEEFEETVTHVIDNTTSDGPKSYVYRWLNKLSRATLKNYGKRLIFQIDIAHPSHYHVSRTVQDQPMLVLPQDPRSIVIGGVTINHPTKINRDNYLAIGDLYHTKLESPPAERVVVSKGFAKKGGERETKSITIPKGYGASIAKMRAWSWNENFVAFIASSHCAIEWWSGPEDFNPWASRQINFNDYSGTLITENLDITIWNEVDYLLNFEIECLLTKETFQAWQVKTFQAIIEAYENMKDEAEAKMSDFNPNLPGLNPQQKMELIRTELKKEALRKMFRCNPLGISDKYVVGQEYQSDCCKDSHNAEKVRFLETVFDWRNITYELFPYFYGSRDVLDDQGKKVSDNWNEIQKLTDSDPHFESFLQASYATVRIPVHRDAAKELAAINFIINNSIANYEVVPAGAQTLLEELEMEPVTMFTYDIDGNELPLPKETLDLGIYNLPTDLVILECGVQNGIKPIGFPQDPTPPTSDVLIPKQYSPAIIADTCPL